jgi:hypothetical protein
MPTPEQLRRQAIAKEVYVSIVGWIWVAAALATLFFAVRAIFFDGVWWPVIIGILR